MTLPSAYRRLCGIGYSLRRLRVDDFYHAQAGLLPKTALVLDLGGHKKRKRGWFDPVRFGLDPVCVNISLGHRPDVCADALALPFAGDTFDAVFCAEMLEHVWDPTLIVAGLFQVLKPGGTALLTIPFLYPVHADPCDFGRYTASFWQRALTDAGFTDLRVTPQGGYVLSLAALMQLGLRDAYERLYARPTVVRKILARGCAGLAVPVAWAGVWLDKRLGGRGAAYTCGYEIVCRKGVAQPVN